MRKHLLKLAFLTLPIFGFSQTYFSDNFDDEDISNWTLYDEDGDGYNWETVNLGTGYTGAIASYSYDNASSSALTPNNYIVSPAINLSTATSAILKFKVKAQDPDWADETYAVYAATTNSVSAFLANGPLLTENAGDNGVGGVFYSKTVDLSSFAGQSQVYIAFRHYNSTDMFSIHIDDVSVEAPATVAPNCATLSSPANGATNLAYLSVPLSWTAPSSGATVDSYDVYLDKNPDPTTLVTNVTGTTYTAANLDASSTYYWKVVPKNSAGSATGCTVYSFTTMAPTYCTAGATSTSFEKISNVTFANINHNSTSTAGYEDFTSIIGNVTAGQTYTFTASFTGISYDQDHVLVWIDFNNDKDFNDAGEQVLVTATKKSPWTGSITIPAGATATTTRMRVRLNDSGSSTSNITPCGTSTFGQVEDYTLAIGQLAATETSKNGIKAYPNPVKDIFNIEAQGKIQSVKVFDTTGKQILTKDVSEAKSQIDFSKFNAGVYVVSTTLADGSTTTTKVIKK